MKFAVILALGFAGSVGWSRPAHAQGPTESATAQALFDDARALMDKGNYEAACPKLEESQRLDPGSGTLINLGDCYEHQGRTASAWTTFLEASAAARVTGNLDRDRESRERASALDARLARLTIRVASERPGVEVRRDGVIVRPAQWGTAIPIDAGAHTISATATGRAPWQTTVTLRDASSETVLIPEMPPISGSPAAPPGSPAPDSFQPGGEGASSAAGRRSGSENTGVQDGLGAQRVAALILGGVGIAGVAVGTIFGFKAMATYDDAQADGKCKGSGCTGPEGDRIIEQARRYGNVSTVAFVAGVAGAVAGTALWLTATPKAPQLGVGMGSLQIRGAW